MPAQPIPSSTDRPSLADAKSRFSASWSEASKASEAGPVLEQAPIPTPPGFVAWRIKGTRGVTVLPLLLPQAPGKILRAYLARVEANLTGRCPLCWATAWIDAEAPDPETHPAGWAALTVTVGVTHIAACEAASFGEPEKHWFDPRAVPR